VRQPEQRLGLVGFLRIVGRRFQVINRANPLLIGYQIFRAFHALRFGRSRVCDQRQYRVHD
jgi:hypothetical protein